MKEHSLMLHSCVMLVFEKFHTILLNNNDNSLKNMEYYRFQKIYEYISYQVKA